MPWILLHQTWQIYPQSIKCRCLEYCYTKLGRSTGRSTPHQLSIDALKTDTPNLADILADLPPINWAEMPWILLHQTWQIYPQSIKHRCLEYCYTKLGRSSGRSIPHQLSIDALNTATPNLADLPPSMEHRCLEYCYTKLSRSTPSQLSVDALNTTTLNLVDLLADLPPINWA